MKAYIDTRACRINDRKEINTKQDRCWQRKQRVAGAHYILRLEKKYQKVLSRYKDNKASTATKSARFLVTKLLSNSVINGRRLCNY